MAPFRSNLKPPISFQQGDERLNLHGQYFTRYNRRCLTTLWVFTHRHPAPFQRPKETVKADPGHFTTIRAKFELPAGVTAPQKYVHHCHIVEHEDNDMMRLFIVTP